MYLASSLEKKGHEVKVIDIAAEGLILPQVIEKIRDIKPGIVGISAMTTGIASAVTLAKCIMGSCLVGLGGVHITCDSSFVKRFPFFDFGVVGEGEKTLGRIADRFTLGGKVTGTFSGEITPDLDDLPFPARHLIDPKIYKRKEQMKFEVPAAGMLASRGCSYNCIFCGIPGRGKKVRFRSAKNIVDEMEEIYDVCEGQYSFVDDCFTINRQRTLEFCQEIIDRKLKCSWIASTHANCLDDELGRYLFRAGCRDLYFGVESGNQEIRNRIIGKHLSESSIEKAIKICRKNKIMSNLFLMVGFPEETRKDMMDTVRIGGKVKADAVGIHITRPMPGSELFKNCIDQNLIPHDLIDKYASGRLGKNYRDNWAYYIPKGSSLEELIEIKKLTYRRFYLSPFWMWRRLMIWFKVRGKFKDDLKLFKIAFGVLYRGGSKGQLS